MRSRPIGSMAITAIMALSLLLPACANEEAGSKKGKDGASGEAKTIAFAWPKDVGPLNPHLYEPSQMFAQGMVYESLVDYAEGGRIVPKLAERWEVSPDGKTYTFHLRRNVVYSDGTPFNADNAKQNLDAILANKKRHSWMGIVNFIEQIEKVDDHTIRIVLNGPYYPVLQELSFVRPFRFLGNAGFPADGSTAATIAKPIGTGPWVLAEYKKDEYALFTRNERYWGEKPKVDRVKVSVIPDPESIVMAFEKKELDLIYGKGVISPDSYDFLEKSGKYDSARSAPLTTRAVIMNSTKDPTSDPKVRAAIQHAINKEALVRSVSHGTEAAAGTIIAPNFPYADDGLKPFEYDPAKAARLLDEAGWKLAPGKSVREKEGRPLTLELIYISTDAVQKPTSEIMQAELAKVGVQVQIKGEEIMVGNARLKSGDYHLNFWSTYGAPNDPHNFITTVSQPATGVYEALQGIPRKREIDGDIKQILIGTDEKRRAELYKSVLTNIHESAVFYPIAYETNVAVFQKAVKGFRFPATKYDLPLPVLDIAR